MCLAVPGRIIKVNGDEAIVELHGNRLRISTLMTPDARAGQWALVHAGFAIQLLDDLAATRTWSVLGDLQARVDADEAAQHSSTTAPEPAP